jgi:predicted CopG family antitoxin
MASAQTTVPVKDDTLRRLRGYKTGGASFDEVLNEMMDEIPPETFVREHLRRLREEEKVSWDSVRARLKL